MHARERSPTFFLFVYCLLSIAACKQFKNVGEPIITLGHTEFTRAVHGLRLTEERWTGDSSDTICRRIEAHEHLIPRTRCSELSEISSKQSQALRRASSRIRRELAFHPSPKSLQAAAIEEIVLSGRNKRSLDRAVERLTEAVEQVPNQPTLHSDLSAAYIIRARFEDRPLDLIRSLAASNRALELDQNLLRAHFNQALAYQLLHLTRPAAESWKKYLELDADSGFAEEARSHLTILNQQSLITDDISEELHRAVVSNDIKRLEQLIREKPGPVYELAEQSLLSEWADEVDQDRNPTQALHLASTLGQALSQTVGDTLLEREVRFLSALGPEEKQISASAHQALSRGLTAYNDRRFSEAATAFSESSRRFSSLNNPWLPYSRYQEARAAYRLADPKRSLSIAQQIAHENPDALSLQARNAWLRGTLHLERVEPAAAIAAYQEALTGFEKIGENEHRASVLSLIAGTHRYLANSKESWRATYQALRAASETGSYRRLPLILGEAARAASQAEQHQIAEVLQNQALREDLMIGDPLAVAESYWRRAIVRFRAKNLAGARRDLENAQRLCAEAPETADRAMIEAGLNVLRAALIRGRKPAHAVQLLDSAQQYYRRTDTEYLSVDLLLEKGRAHLALNDLEQAEQSLHEGMDVYERQMKSVFGVRSRIRFFDRAEEIVEEMVLLQIDRLEDPTKAWIYAERGKARGLLQQIAEKEERPLEPDDSLLDLRRSLTDRQALLEWMILQERSFVWLVSRHHVELYEISSGTEALNNLTHSFRTEIQRQNSTSAYALAEKLGHILLGPLQSRLKRFEELILVPDRNLHSLPFSALIDPDNGRFMIESYALTFAPSAMTYQAALQNVNSARPASALRVLAIGDPAFDEIRYPRLRRLQGARAEAQDLAARFPGSLLLIDHEATAERFLTEANRFDVLHLAMHSQANSETPFRSKLILAPKGADQGDIYAEQIIHRRWTRPQFAVLSACSTAQGHKGALEGVSHLGRAFVAAGVPVVLTTLWDLPDENSQRFFRKFYRHLQAGATPAKALQKAQIDSLDRQRDPQLPFKWAVYQIVGAGHKNIL